ncbi:MAG: TonB-dependent receptor [Bryobacteraceae bacterium]
MTWVRLGKHFLLGSLLFLSGVVFAQEYRATLLGVIADPSGASVAGAKVTVTNINTGVITTAEVNSGGEYLVPFLLPGTYRLTVEHPGFKSYERSPIELHVNDRTRIDVQLQVGEVTDHISVVAEAPLLEVSSSSRGQVVDNRQVSELPLNGRNPYTLMNLSTGVQYTGSLFYFRPFDNGAIADFSINGGRSGVNEFQIDGVPNNANSGRNDLSYVPPAEAVQEFKIQTNTYDAQYGRTSGGVISLSIKPGTNTYHGAGYEYLRRTSLEANQFANNASGAPRAKRLVDQYGFEVDGPATIPGLYRGKDRTFFMFAFEKYRESVPNSSVGSVPTAEQRAGDFSQTLTSARKLYTIYDPLTITPNPAYDPTKAVTLSNLNYIRTPFAGNQVPSSRMNSIATRVLKDIPLPNQNGDSVTHMNNWLATNAAEVNHFHNVVTRVDHNIGSNWRLFGRWDNNQRRGDSNYSDWDTPGNRQISASRRNDGAAFDVLGTLNPTTVLNFRLGFNRFKYWSVYEPMNNIAATLGFPQKLASQLPLTDKYPVFTFTNYMTVTESERPIQPNDNYSIQSSLLKTKGSHSMKFGFEYRLMRFAQLNRTNGSGNYAFTRSWTSASPQVDNSSTGNAIASFLLGYMSSGYVTANPAPYLRWNYPVVFFQDDWQVNRRLTLNLGLRWDMEGPAVERYDRQTRGFDFTSKSPYQVTGLDLRGGLLFAGVNGQPRGAFDADTNNWQPRLGLAYKVLTSTPLVFRAGVGRYYVPTVDYGSTTGFGQTTYASVSTADFLPYRTLSDPLPDGLLQPPGASLGLATQVGDSVSFSDPRRTVPYVWQYSAGFQWELTPGMLVEASYVGSQTRERQVSQSMSYLTTEQLALGTSYLNQKVSNPFYGVLPVGTSRGAQSTIQRRSLLTQYPHFTGVTMSNVSLGTSWYNSLQFKFERRFKQGLTFLVSYTASKTMETASYLNAQDENLSRELTSFDVPQRLVASGIYEFPVGPRKRFFNSGALAHVIGGWQFNWSMVFQSGTPMAYPSGYYLRGNPKLESGQSLRKWFDTSSSLWVQQPADTLRTIPIRSPNIRRHTAPQLDLSLYREFAIKEAHRLQFRAMAFNASNTPVFNFPTTSPSSPLFGVVSDTAINRPRSVELGFRYVF